MSYEPTTDVELRAIKKWFLRNFPMPGWKIKLTFSGETELNEITENKRGEGSTVFGCAAWEPVSRQAWAFIAEPAIHQKDHESLLETCFHELGHIFWESEEPPSGSTIPQERRLNIWAKVLARLYRQELEQTTE